MVTSCESESEPDATPGFLLRRPPGHSYVHIPTGSGFTLMFPFEVALLSNQARSTFDPSPR